MNDMAKWQAILYIIAIVLLVVAALPLPTGKVSLALLGAAVGLLAYALPIINAI